MKFKLLVNGFLIKPKYPDDDSGVCCGVAISSRIDAAVYPELAEILRGTMLYYTTFSELVMDNEVLHLVFADDIVGVYV